VPDTPAGGFPDEIDGSAYRLAWEVPETGAVAVLAAVGVLMVGGLVAGVVAANSPSYGGGTPLRISVSTAISFGATWAGPLLAIALLAIVGLCWWQAEAWGAVSEPDHEFERAVEAVGHIQRAHRICWWAQAELLLVCLGAVALVVSSALLSTGGLNAGAVNWVRIIVEVANLLAVLAVASVGAWIGRKVDVDPESSG
jgi:hypothetical protein